MFSRVEERWIHEKHYRRGGFRLIAGVDEAGRGALAGPVVAAAVILPEEFNHPDLDDSKVLSPEKREELYAVIIEEAVSYAVASASSEEIDQYGILRATLLAMTRALEALDPSPQLALIDGQFTTPWRGLQKAVIDGDARCLSVAAASILAKVTRDRFMEEADQEFPEYGFFQHKGYATRRHLEALRQYGPCPIHRRSFRPVAEAQGCQESWTSGRKSRGPLLTPERL